MSSIEKKARIYLNNFYKLSNLKLTNETKDKITFSLGQSEFVPCFYKFMKLYGEYKAYPVDAGAAVSQVDSVWRVFDGAHVILTTNLTDTSTEFFITLLNADSYQKDSLAVSFEKKLKSFAALEKTKEWQNFGQKTDLKSLLSDGKKVVKAAKKVGLSR